MQDEYCDVMHSIEEMVKAAYMEGYSEGHTDGRSCSAAPSQYACKCFETRNMRQTWLHSESCSALKK